MKGRAAATAAAVAIVLLLAGCVAVAWPAGSLLVPRNSGHPVGDPVWSWAFLAMLAAAFCAYAAALLAAGRGLVSRRVALAVAVVVQLLPLAAPLLLSTDAWSYWDYGRLAAVHGVNPYATAPSAFPLDPAFAHMGAHWRDTTTVYGPAFTLVSEPLALAAGASADAAAWIYKVAAALAMVVATVLAGRLSRRPALAVVAVGWSPLLAVHAAGAGHNDAWVAALVLGALAAATSRRPALAGAGWALGALVKWVPLVLLPLRLLAASRRGATGRTGPGSSTALPARAAMAAGAGFAGVVAVVATVASWRYGGGWLGALGPLARSAGATTRFSLSGRLQQAGVPHGSAVALSLAALVVAAVPLAVAAFRGRPRLGLASVLLVGLSPLLAPWYLLWAVPLAAADDDVPALLLALALGGYVLSQTVPLSG